MTRFLLTLLIYFLTGCLQDPREQAPRQVNWKPSVQVEIPDSSTPPLEFMVAPWLSTQELVQIYSPLLKHLASHLGQNVRLNVAPNYPTLLRLIEGGRIDIAQVNARSLQSLLKRPDTYRYIGTVKHLSPTGTPTYGSRGILFANHLSPLDKGAATRLRLGLIDKRSTSGYLLPKLWLAKRGVDLTDFQDVLFLGSHTKAFTALIDNRVDIIASWNGQLILEKDRLSEELVKIAETGDLPNDAWVTAGSRQDELQAELRKWLGTLPPPEQPSNLYTKTSAFAGLKPLSMDSYRAIPQLEP